VESDVTAPDRAARPAEGADRWTLAISEVWSLYYRWRGDPKREKGDADACLRVIERLEAARPAPAAAPAGVASVPTVDPRAARARHLHVPDWRWCTCGQFWRGDAATGGCEAVLLARLAERWATDYFAMRDDCNAMATKAVAEFNRAEKLAREVVALRERAERAEAEREDREDYARMRVKQYSAEVSGPNLAEAEAELAALRERAERAERMCDSLQEERDALWLSGSDHERRVALLAGLCAEMVRAVEGHPPRDPFAIVDDMRAALADGG
jgi:hypothetical protein